MYISLADFEKAYGSDDLKEDVEQMQDAFERASKLIDVYVRSAGIEVPLTNQQVINDIRGHCLDIARYFVWNDSNNEKIRKNYEDAISFLEKVATRKIQLIATGTSSSNSTFKNIRLVRG